LTNNKGTTSSAYIFPSGYFLKMKHCSMEEIVEMIHVMRQQEETIYATRDWLTDANHVNPLCLDVDRACRSKMCAWSYQVVDFCNFQRETVEMSLNYLDRYLLTSTGARALRNRSIFQLAAMTSLYTAVKIHEPEAMDPKLVSSLSRGTYTPKEVEAMEHEILNAIQWRVNPPTALSFVRQFLNLIPHEAMDEEMRANVYDIARFQTEIAAKEYDFMLIKPSITGYCSFINALDSMDLDTKFVQRISALLVQAIGLDLESSIFTNVQNYFYQAVLRQPVLTSSDKVSDCCHSSCAHPCLSDPHPDSPRACSDAS
jgi:hypothetical protein